MADVPPVSPTPDQEVLEAVLAGSAALVAKDAAALDPLLSDDFLYTTAEGQVLGKAAYLARYLEAPDVHWYAQDLDDIRVRVYGASAVVICRVHDIAALGDQGINAFSRATYSYVVQAGRWRCVAGQAAPDPGDADLHTITFRLYDIQRAIDARAEFVPAWLGALGADGAWPDIDYADQTPGPWLTNEHLIRLLTMARRYSAPGQSFYQDAALRNAILAALNFWLAHDFQNPNWWHNQIGVPTSIGYTLLLMRPEITPAQHAQGMTILQRASLSGKTGANLTWSATVVLVRGSLALAPDLVAEAMAALYGELKIAGPGQEGVQADWSFHQHDALLYSGGYGQAYTVDAARFVLYAYNTRFAAPDAQYAVLAGHILDGQQWMMRGDTFDYSAIGRQIARPDQNGRAVVTVARQLAGIGGQRQAEFQALAARGAGDPQAPPLVGNRHFWKSDFMAHQRASFYVSARMVSTRLYNTDGYINGEGRQTNNLAYGATLLYRTGQEYRNIFPVWDWQRVPGVTCEQFAAPLDPAGLHVHGQTSFVGGVSDGLYGMAAMDLQLGSLAAKKAWFFFDEEWVCLGAGIACATDNPVLTSVNQCLRGGDVTVAGPGYKYTARGVGVHSLRDGWVHHDRVGYHFPADVTATIRHMPQFGSWAAIGAGSPDPLTLDVFNIWISHGAHPADARYHYTIYPDIDVSALDALVAEQRVMVLSNSAALQAVLHRPLGLCAMALYQAGALAGPLGWNLAADQPCLLLLREQQDGMLLAVANPENQQLTVTITIDRVLEGDGCVPLDEGHTQITVELPGGDTAGSSVVRQLKKANAEPAIRVAARKTARSTRRSKK